MITSSRFPYLKSCTYKYIYISSFFFYPSFIDSYPLCRRNIYYHPLETGTMRDIFLQPFNDQLLGCVAAMYFILLFAMTTIIYAAKMVLHDMEEKHVGIGEATLWCLSIMCMQGYSFSCSYWRNKRTIVIGIITFYRFSFTTLSTSKLARN